VLVIFGEGSVFSELIMERSQRESWRSEQAAHMLRMGWEAASDSCFPIPAHKKEGREEVSLVLLWRGKEKGMKNGKSERIGNNLLFLCSSEDWC